MNFKKTNLDANGNLTADQTRRITSISYQPDNAYNTTDRLHTGKEFHSFDGLFHYDFGARHYDPVLPMFNGYDPMAEDNIHVSPLAYCHGKESRRQIA